MASAPSTPEASAAPASAPAVKPPVSTPVQLQAIPSEDVVAKKVRSGLSRFGGETELIPCMAVPPSVRQLRRGPRGQHRYRVLGRRGRERAALPSCVSGGDGAVRERGRTG